MEGGSGRGLAKLLDNLTFAHISHYYTLAKIIAWKISTGEARQIVSIIQLPPPLFSYGHPYVC